MKLPIQAEAVARHITAWAISRTDGLSPSACPSGSFCCPNDTQCDRCCVMGSEVCTGHNCVISTAPHLFMLSHINSSS